MAVKPMSSIMAATGTISSPVRLPPSSDWFASRNVVSTRRSALRFFFTASWDRERGALLLVAPFDLLVGHPKDASGEPCSVLRTRFADGDCRHRDAGRHLDYRIQGVEPPEMLRRYRHPDHRQVRPGGDDSR